MSPFAPICAGQNVGCAGVGLHHAHAVALIDQQIEVARRVNPDRIDLALRLALVEHRAKSREGKLLRARSWRSLCVQRQSQCAGKQPREPPDQRSGPLARFTRRKL